MIEICAPEKSLIQHQMRHAQLNDESQLKWLICGSRMENLNWTETLRWREKNWSYTETMQEKMAE